MIANNPSKDVNNYHINDDVDSSQLAHHHTLGFGVNQAAPGKVTDTRLKALEIINSCRVFRSANLSVADLTTTQVPFTNERWDSGGMHDNAVNNTRITITKAGLYSIGFHGNFQSATDYVRANAFIRLNGVTIIGQGNSAAVGPAGIYIHAHTEWDLSVGDYLEIDVVQDNTANASRNLIASSARSPEFFVTEMGQIA